MSQHLPRFPKFSLLLFYHAGNVTRLNGGKSAKWNKNKIFPKEREYYATIRTQSDKKEMMCFSYIFFFILAAVNESASVALSSHAAFPKRAASCRKTKCARPRKVRKLLMKEANQGGETYEDLRRGVNYGIRVSYRFIKNNFISAFFFMLAVWLISTVENRVWEGRLRNISGGSNITPICVVCNWYRFHS